MPPRAPISSRAAINRIILATDGDFNVGVSDNKALEAMVERKRDDGITLTTLGFGTGNYNEAMMEQIADVGNGNYAYIDSAMRGGEGARRRDCPRRCSRSPRT